MHVLPLEPSSKVSPSHEEIPLIASVARLLLWALQPLQASEERAEREARAQESQVIVRTCIALSHLETERTEV